MNTTRAVNQPPATTASHAEVVEQVMRCCGDELLVLPFLAVEPATRSASAALGRLLSAHPIRLVGGCALISFVAGVALDPHWRDAYPPKAGSLWAELEFLRLLYGPRPEAADPYEELEALRRHAESDVGVADTGLPPRI